MNIKYIGNSPSREGKGKIHIDNGNFTGCGIRIDDNPDEWVSTSEAVTCEKNGCKNK